MNKVSKRSCLVKTLRLCSIFENIDGEVNGFMGAGQRTLFIRLQGCNLRCHGKVFKTDGRNTVIDYEWKCDTQYALDSDGGEEITVEELLKRIPVNSYRVTITGGEPFLQRNIYDLIDGLTDRGKLVSIETNGSLFPDMDRIARVREDQLRLIVDCKPPSSGQSEFMVYELYKYLLQNDVVKFVVADHIDMEHAKNVILEHMAESPAYIAFAPVWRPDQKRKEYYARLRDIVEFIRRQCFIDYNIGISFQVHKLLWPEAGQGPGNEK